MKAKVLIVDDSSLSRRTLRMSLEELGHTVQEAPDGAQALERFVVDPPDLVILDMVMTGMYGLDVLARMQEINPAIPVIIATADVQTSTAEQAKAAGARSLLNKPVNRALLATTLATVLGGGHMELTPDQKDALTELINIGYGRAAGALSELTGYRITLEVPQVSMHPIESIGPMLGAIFNPPIASVNQRFSGPVSGTAMLMLDEASALMLSHLLSADRKVNPDFDLNTREIITEVGNILLNACLGVFGNLLQIQLSFAVPRLHHEKVGKVIDLIASQSDEPLSYGLLMHTRFRAKAEDVTGYLVIVLGIQSMDRLLLELNKWENRQME